MLTLNQWLLGYQDSHQHPMNKTIHLICVPIIFLMTLNLLWLLPPMHFLGLSIDFYLLVNTMALLFYYRLDAQVFKLMGLSILGHLVLVNGLNYSLSLFWMWCLTITLFALAWALQFYGHHLEGKKPSLLEDLKFMLIAPLWVFVHFGLLQKPQTPQS